MESNKEMILVEIFTVLAVFGGFGFLIWSRLVQRNHPIVAKVQEWMKKPKEKLENLKESEGWQQPNIERKIY